MGNEEVWTGYGRGGTRGGRDVSDPPGKKMDQGRREEQSVAGRSKCGFHARGRQDDGRR